MLDLGDYVSFFVQGLDLKGLIGAPLAVLAKNAPRKSICQGGLPGGVGSHDVCYAAVKLYGEVFYAFEVLQRHGFNADLFCHISQMIVLLLV